LIWTTGVQHGEPRDISHEFEIAAVAVSESRNEFLLDWAKKAENSSEAQPPVWLPLPEFVIAGTHCKVKKGT